MLRKTSLFFAYKTKNIAPNNRFEYVLDRGLSFKQGAKMLVYFFTTLFVGFKITRGNFMGVWNPGDEYWFPQILVRTPHQSPKDYSGFICDEENK